MISTGTSGADTLSGTTGADTIQAMDGDDVVLLGSGDDELDGGAGFDELRYLQLSGPAVSLTLDLSLTTAQQTGLGSQRLRDFEALRIVTTGNNRLWGGAAADMIVAGMAADYIDGRDGDDTLVATGGADTLIGGAGADLLSIEGGGNHVEAGAGNDTVTLTESAGLNVIDLGDGPQDKLVIRMGGTLDLSGASSERGDRVTGVEIIAWDGLAGYSSLTLTGADQGSLYQLSSGAMRLSAGAGNDRLTLYAMSGAIDAGSGNDRITSTSDSANIQGGAGDDVIFALWSVGMGRRIEGGAGHDRLEVAQNHDVIRLLGGAGSDTILASQGNDWIFADGGDGDDLIRLVIENSSLGTVAELHGGAGNDRLQASSAALGKGARLFGQGGRDHLTGTGYSDLLDGGSGVDTLIGGAGNDSYSVTSGDVVVERAGQGSNDKVWAHGSYSLPDYVENVLLVTAVSAKLRGNAANNRITGNVGDDYLDGLGGKDTLIGGAGHDRYRISAGDVVIEQPNGGRDTIQSAYHTVLPAQVEALVLLSNGAINGTGNGLSNIIHGNAGANILRGNGGNDVLRGYAGRDTLVGGGGRDTLIGGGGDDQYYVDGGDFLVEKTGGGRDMVRVGMNYKLLNNFEDMTLTDRAYRADGNNIGNNIWGNNYDNRLIGYDGHDALYGRGGSDILIGGAGRDTLIGGTGNDIYFSDGYDVVIEQKNQGRDHLKCTINHVLERNVEDMTLYGNHAFNGFGNDANNHIFGNHLGNRLDGRGGIDRLYGYGGNDRLFGGAGKDYLYGGPGNDIYYVDKYDVVYEEAGAGRDVIRATYDMHLPANVEDLVLTHDRAIQGHGNGADNHIYGTGRGNILKGYRGNDTIYGYGGGDTIIGGNGRDRLEGGGGDDIYYCDAGDVVIEQARHGRDVIKVNFSYHLPANVEELVLTSTGNFHAIGNAMNNRIIGNQGRNRIDGGAGNDVLWGRGGADQFVFSDGADRIMDFRDNVDTLYLDRDLIDGARIGVRALLRDYAEVAGGHTTLDFGDGDRVFLHGIGNKWALLDDIVIFG